MSCRIIAIGEVVRTPLPGTIFQEENTNVVQFPLPSGERVRERGLSYRRRELNSAIRLSD